MNSHLEIIIFNYLVNKDALEYNQSIRSYIANNSVYKYAEEMDNLERRNSTLYFEVTTCLHSNIISQLKSYADLNSLDAKEEAKTFAAVVVDGLSDHHENAIAVAKLLAMPATHILSKYAKLGATLNCFNMLASVPAEQMELVECTANKILQYIADEKLLVARIEKYEAVKHQFKDTSGYRSAGHNAAVAIKETLPSSMEYTTWNVLNRVTNSSINYNTIVYGLNKLIAIAGFKDAPIKVDYVNTVIQALIHRSFGPTNYVEYTTDYKALADTWKLKARTGHTRLGNMLLSGKDSAFMALLSSNTVEEAKSVMEVYGKTRFKYQLPTSDYYYNEFNTIVKYKDNSRNLLLNSSIETLAKLYPSRYFINTMLIAKHFSGVLTDAEIQWALTHVTNSNIQHGAMLFMETLCSCNIEQHVTETSTCSLTTLRVVNTKNNGRATLSQTVEKKYNLSYAMYGLYI